MMTVSYHKLGSFYPNQIIGLMKLVILACVYKEHVKKEWLAEVMNGKNKEWGYPLIESSSQ